MKSQQKSGENPLPGRSCTLIRKPHKEKCYGNKNRIGGAFKAS